MLLKLQYNIGRCKPGFRLNILSRHATTAEEA
jgi:hypothetical protein